MKYFILILFILFSNIRSQDCPPSDTLTVESVQNFWNLPNLNRWNGIEIITWNIKNFPISSNTINYTNEIISDILPDIIAFQEINDASAFNVLANSLSAYEFISSGSGLALAVRSDIINIISWTTLFSNNGYEFAWRYPLIVEINWSCGTDAISLKIINIHLKSGSSSEDFERRYASSQLLSEYIDDNLNDNIILLGDYNDEITDSDNTNSLLPLISNESVIFLTEEIANLDYYASFPSWPSFIDHIAISSPLFDEAENGTINTIRIDDYTGYNNFQNNISDHRPVIWSFTPTAVDLMDGLIINEIMHNPTIVSDAVGEWIEITNISNNIINLNGLVLRDNDGEQHTILNNELIIAPGNFLVLGKNSDPSINGGIQIDYIFSDFTLSNLWDEIILQHPSGVILDEVYYDNGETFPDTPGSSMMLINPTLDNNHGDNWITSTITYGDGDYGTPGYSNYTNECTELIGDVNYDNVQNVLDVIALVNCVITTTCEGCSGDINNDLATNILDVVALVNCIISNTCNG